MATVQDLMDTLQNVDENLTVQVVVDLGQGETNVADFSTDTTNIDGEPVFTIRVEN